MNSAPDAKPDWGSSFRLTASEKWKAKSAAMGRDVTEALVDYAQPRPGMQVLDLASGTGEPAITLASRIGPTGHVTALDLSPDLLAIAARRASQRGFANVTTRQADAQHLPFPDRQFDLATCRFGVMFFADFERALRDLRRVLKSGARACFAAWGSKDQPYFSSSIGIVHRRIGGPLLAPGGPDPFRFSLPGSLSEALSKSGFTKVHEEIRALPWTWPGPVEEVWEQQQAVATPFLPLLKRVPPEKWPEINAEIHTSIRNYEDKGAIKFGALIVLASGQKP
ncbi:MAG: class I SAM-dependent methyltransferase [Terriglobales bacterium]